MKIGQVLFEIQARKARKPHARSAEKILLTFDLIFDLLFYLEFLNRGVLWNCLIEIYRLICYILIGSLVLEIVGGQNPLPSTARKF